MRREHHGRLVRSPQHQVLQQVPLFMRRLEACYLEATLHAAFQQLCMGDTHHLYLFFAILKSQ